MEQSRARVLFDAWHKAGGKEFRPLAPNQSFIIPSDSLFKSLGERASFVWFHTGKEQVYSLVGNVDSFVLHKLAPTQQIDSLSNTFSQYVSDFKASENEIKEVGKTLFPLLFPHPDNLPERIIISTDGALTRIPFDALVQANGEYFIQKHILSYALSASTLTESSSPSASMSMIAISPEKWKNASLAPLKKERGEVQHICKKGCEKLEGSQATKSLFKALLQSFPTRIIHFSTHAKAGHSLDPKESWVAFSDHDSQDSADYFMYLDEIYAMSLPMDMAFLSGCETGIGTVTGGEGALSLARAFTYAGCKSVISTLWPVEHEPNAWIVQKFYHYLNKGFSKDNALRQAKLDFLNPDEQDQWERKPNRWAALTALGNMEPTIIIKDKPPYAWYLVIAVGLLLFFVFLKKSLKK
ncbi:MAG: CHAT domain-containing protein [Bacteroidia bacterium]